MSEDCYIYDIIHLLAINHQRHFVLDALMKRMLALGYLHVTFLLKVRTHLHKSELIEVTKIKFNKRPFGFHETDHIQIHNKICITDGI